MSRVIALTLLSLALSAPVGPSVPEALPTTTQLPAGRLSHDTLYLSLEARAAFWRPDEQDSPPANILAFAEQGKAPTVPGPLIRVRSGTVIVATVRNNALADSALVLHGFLAHPATKDDTVRIPRGASRVITFRSGAPGTYAYWGSTTGEADPSLRGSYADATLGGALVVDPADGPIANDRIFVITQIDFDSDGSRPRPNYERFQVAINGRAWPHTERIHVTQGDTVRFRWVNTGFEQHPMHLHGFYFRIDSRSGPLADTIYSPAQRRLAVTERLDPGTTMAMTWVPDRTGNWLMHCHIAAHVAADLVYPWPGDTVAHYPSLTGNAPMNMSGLILGLVVAPRPGAPLAPSPVKRRELRMVLRPLPFLIDGATAVSVSIGDTGFAPRTGRHDVPVPTLALARGEPVRIWVVNRLPSPASVHWHGLEIESYSDGVAGWSGSGTHLAPMIAPGDSFAADLTPPRAGTFIYHSHMDHDRALAGGLYGALVVADSAAPYDPARDLVLLFGGGDPPLYRSLYLNGSLTPAPRALTAGVKYHVRLVDIAENFNVQVVLTQGARPVKWRALAKDGAELPEALRTMQPATAVAAVGETLDFEFTPPRPGDYFLEIVRATGVVSRQLWRVSP